MGCNSLAGKFFSRLTEDNNDTVEPRLSGLGGTRVNSQDNRESG